jgi:hypothetical protein
LTNGEIVHRLDSFYSDKANLNIAIPAAIMCVDPAKADVAKEAVVKLRQKADAAHLAAQTQ